MKKIKFLTAGESHGQALIGILEGLPAGICLSHEEINNEVARRKKGFGRSERMQIEEDDVEFISGVRFGETLGSPISLRIKNKDHTNWCEEMSFCGAKTRNPILVPRPGHADFAGTIKYARRDIRDILERASARETAMRVAMGAILKEFLHLLGIKISSRVIKISSVVLDEFQDIFPHDKAYPKEKIEKAFIQEIASAKKKGDTVGGVFEIKVQHVPIGLGSHISWEEKIDAQLAMALMSIQGIKGVEFGDGFSLANMYGSLAHDALFLDEEKKISRKTNHAGGIEGGMTNGEDIIIKNVMKPIPTLMQPLHSVNLETREDTLATVERSDVCAVFSAAVVGESMVALVMADTVLSKFGGDSMQDVLYAYKRAKFK